jgi:hypothetical protein
VDLRLLSGLAIWATIRMALPPPLTRHAPILRAPGWCFCRNGLRLISRLGVIREIGPLANTRCGMPASGLSRPAMDPASRAVVTKCPCGEVFDMHGPEAGLMHVPHITATEAVQVQ